MAPGADGDAAGPYTSDARQRLEAIRVSLLREMNLRLSMLDQSGGALVGQRAALDNARRIRTQVLELLREDGLPIVVDIAEDRVARAVDQALRSAPRSTSSTQELAGVSVTFDPEAKASIARSVSGVLDEVTLVFRDASVEIRKAIDVGVNTGSSLADVTADVAKAMKSSFGKAANLVDTAIRMATQKAILDKGQAAADELGVELVWLYDGPRDSITRRFCQRILGKAYTRKAMDRLENDAGMPAATARGGVNCRHRWVPLLMSTAIEEGIEVVDV